MSNPAEKPAEREVELRKRRVAVYGTVKVTSKKGGAPELFKFIDLSMGGLFVRTIVPVEIGSVVDLELRILRAPFEVSATVAWIRPYEEGPDKPWGMGLEFGKLSAVQRSALYRQLSEAVERGSEALPGTPPTPAERARREARAPLHKRGTLWTRLTRSLT